MTHFKKYWIWYVAAAIIIILIIIYGNNQGWFTKSEFVALTDEQVASSKSNKTYCGSCGKYKIYVLGTDCDGWESACPKN